MLFRDVVGMPVSTPTDRVQTPWRWNPLRHFLDDLGIVTGRYCTHCYTIRRGLERTIGLGRTIDLCPIDIT